MQKDKVKYNIQWVFEAPPGSPQAGLGQTENSVS